MYGYPPPPGYGPPGYGPPGFGPPGFGSPYGMPTSPLAPVRTGAMLIAGTLTGILALEILETVLFDLLHVGFLPFRMFGWLRICGMIVMLVGVVMTTRLPRAFGVQLAGWSAFAFLLCSLLLSLYQRFTMDLMGSGSTMGQWFLTTASYGCLTPLVMVLASQTGIRWGAATNAVVGSVVGIWRVGQLYMVLRSMDDDYGGGYGYGYGYAYGDNHLAWIELLLLMPAMGALATLFFELRALRDLPAFGPPAPPMAPYPGGFNPPPPMGGYGPPPGY